MPAKETIGSQMTALFHQLECLNGLYVDLRLEKSLPCTRGWAASPDFLQEIALHALSARPEVVLECGSGVSTTVLARCMQINGSGHVYSLEHLPDQVEKTEQELERHHLSAWATVLYSPLRSYVIKGETSPWYSTEGLPEISFDMLIIDGPPKGIRQYARYPAGPLLMGRLKAGGVGFVDDANRPDETTILQQWAGEFPDLKQESRRCEKGCVVLWKTVPKEVSHPLCP
jgi:predicted O-methyltransferase YrrM